MVQSHLEISTCPEMTLPHPEDLAFLFPPLWFVKLCLIISSVPKARLHKALVHASTVQNPFHVSLLLCGGMLLIVGNF